MERFRDDGHLTDEALSALIQQVPMGELERLEIAEHLAFCDICLQRYTTLLTDAPLLTPGAKLPGDPVGPDSPAHHPPGDQPLCHCGCRRGAGADASLERTPLFRNRPGALRIFPGCRQCGQRSAARFFPALE